MKAPYSDATYSAVLHLLKQGQAPSWRRVREITGTGSSNDIMREIKAIMAEIASKASAGEYPKDVQDAFLALWVGAKSAAADEHAEHRALADHQVEQARANEQSSLEAAEQARAETATVRSELAILREHLADAKTREQQLNQQLQVAGERLEAAAGRESALNEQVAALGAKLLLQQQDAQTALQAEVNLRHQAVAEITVEHRAVVARLETSLRSETERYNTDTALIMKKWDDERTELRKEVRQGLDTNKVLQNELQAAQGRKVDLEASVTILKASIQQRDSRIQELQDSLHASETRSEQANRQLAELTMRLTAPTDEAPPPADA